MITPPTIATEPTAKRLEWDKDRMLLTNDNGNANTVANEIITNTRLVRKSPNAPSTCTHYKICLKQSS